MSDRRTAAEDEGCLMVKSDIKQGKIGLKSDNIPSVQKEYFMILLLRMAIVPGFEWSNIVWKC